MELGPFEAHGCSWNTGNLENRWDNRELRNHQDPWGYRDAPGALGCLGTEGALGCSGMQWDGAGRAGSPGMRRCGLKAPPRGSRRELPGEPRGTGRPEAPGHGASQHPGKHGATGIPGWNESPWSPQPPGMGPGRISAHLPWEHHQRGPLSAQSHQPSRKNPERRRDGGILGRVDVNAWNVISDHGPG